MKLAIPFVVTSSNLMVGLFASVLQAQVEPVPTTPPAPPPPAATPPAPEPPAEPAPLPTEPAPPVAEPAPVVEPEPQPVPVPVTPEPAPAVDSPAPVPIEEPAAEPEPAGPAAPEFLPLRVTGSIWSRYELREGFQEHNLSHPRLHREGDYIVSRARLGLATTPVDVGEGTFVSGTFVPQAAYTMGTTGAPVTIADTPPVALYEGYASVGNDFYQVDVGRFAMNYGDALIIGNLDWNEFGRGFTGARVHLTPSESPMFIDAFATLLVEGRALTLEPVAGDTYFYGAYAGLGPLLSETMALDVYALFQTLGSFEVEDPADDTVTLEREPATEITLGVRTTNKIAILDYRLEAGFQFGKVAGAPTTDAPLAASVDKSAYQVDGEVGVSPVKGLRISAGGFLASGDDLSTADTNEGWDELYPTGHKWLGLTDVTGARTNIAGGRGGVKYAGLQSLVMAVDAHVFSRVETDATDVDGSMGSELDFNLIHPIGKGAVLRTMYGIFLPSEDFWTPKSTNPDNAGDPIHYLEVQFGYDFK